MLLKHKASTYIVCILMLIAGMCVAQGQQDLGNTEKAVRTYIAANWQGTVEHVTESRNGLIPLPFPYSVPTVLGEKAFKEMYYWDTYFTNVGLLRDGQFEQAKNNVNNILYLVKKYGKMLNGSNEAFLNRSQPPYLSMMVNEIFEAAADKDWLRDAVGILETEYAFWMKERITPNGLNRYGSSASKEELEGMARLLRERIGGIGSTGDLQASNLLTLGGHAVAEAESGWDFNPRFDNRCLDFNPIDLNSNLYGYERNFAKFYRILGDPDAAANWDAAAEQRKERINRYCLDKASNLFADYDYVNEELSDLVSAAQFSVLFNGVADQPQAMAVVNALDLLETPFGIRTCMAGERSHSYQWDNPNGWPPLHYLAVNGLHRYGFTTEAKRIGLKYVRMVADNFVKTGNLWEKYNVEDGSVNTVNEYEMPKFLGWTAGAFIGISELINEHPDYYAAQRNSWLEKAKANMPMLVERVVKPRSLVAINVDSNAFQGYAHADVSSVNRLYAQPLPRNEALVIDFGEHLTGHFSFVLKALGQTADAPIRLKLTFGEVPAEVATSFDPYPGGLSRAWLQDEVVTVMRMDETVTIPRRLSFRFVKVEIVGAPSYEVAFRSLEMKATTSAAATLESLRPEADEQIRQIDQVAMNTLKECMQTVFEDGPKRDQRLWIGDLYLQSLANNHSFNQQDLTRRCLYLLAGLSGENGYLHATVFERPFPQPQKGQFLLEYALLFNATLKAYFDATGDTATVMDLWPVVIRQLDIVDDLVPKDGLVDFESAIKNWWVFFDWKDGLHKEAALQGFFIFALSETLELARSTGNHDQLKHLPKRIEAMKKAARDRMFDKHRGVFVGTKDPQVSYASQLWMVLGGVVSGKQAQQVLRTVAEIRDAVLPNSPYLYHYYTEALVQAGLHTEARKALVDYWGGMVKKGADTFWEVYNEDDDYLSPYGFYPMNSYCHAWSCTPIYFIRKYPEIFQ